MKIDRFTFGQLSGKDVEGFVLHNGNGLSATLISYGARLTRFELPGRDGKLADIVLGFDDIASYVATNTYFGATCGRYGNRIRHGRYEIDGQVFHVDCNEGPNHLHGGRNGFDRKLWQASADEPTNAVTFSITSPAGDEGFPGAAQLSATYRLTDDDVLEIRMQGTTDAPTILNAVHHTYWNLAGQGSGDVRDQELTLFSDFYTPVDAELITTGEVLSVAGTAFDFRLPKPIGKDIDTLQDVGIGDLVGGGYDHNWCLNGVGRGLHPCARVVHPKSGRGFELRTNEPGVQFYTGGYLDEKVIGKQGKPYCRFAGYTFETQKFPNSPNFAHFPSSVLYPGELYDHRMVFRFFTDTWKGTNSMANLYEGAVAELTAVFQRLNDADVDHACRMIADAKTVVVFGGGRERLQIMGFAMRLYHMGLSVAVEGDMTTPPVGKGDLFVVTVGPGEISTALALLEVAEVAGATILVVTAQPTGRATAYADFVLHLPAQTMADDRGEKRSSVLPMGSLYEGALFVLFEIMILKLMKMLKVNPENMRANHTNLE